MARSGGNGHLLALDGARGVAALAVFGYHLGSLDGGRSWLPGSFLAVDFFFLLSGFVVAMSYEGRLRSGAMSVAGFARARIVRLYPLYLAACLVGLAYFASKVALGRPDAPGPGQMAAALGPAALLAPHPGAAAWSPSDYPFAPSAWTLTFELWGTILYAAVAARLRSWHLGLLAVLGTALLVQQARSFGTLDLGYGQATFLGGLARFVLSFSLGVLVWRQRRLVVPAWALPLVVAVPALAFVVVPHGAVALGLVWIAVVFPLALVALASARVPAWATRPLDHLGRLSYALYILHAPVILFVAALLKLALGDGWNASPALLASCCVLAVVGLSALATYLFDEPLRARLRRRPAVSGAAGAAVPTAP